MRALTVLLCSAQPLLTSAWAPNALSHSRTSPALAIAMSLLARVGEREVNKVYHPTMRLYADDDDASLVSPPRGWPLAFPAAKRVHLVGELNGKPVRLTGPPTGPVRGTPRG